MQKDEKESAEEKMATNSTIALFGVDQSRATSSVIICCCVNARKSENIKI